MEQNKQTLPELVASPYILPTSFGSSRRSLFFATARVSDAWSSFSFKTIVSNKESVLGTLKVQREDVYRVLQAES